MHANCCCNDSLRDGKVGYDYLRSLQLHRNTTSPCRNVMMIPLYRKKCNKVTLKLLLSHAYGLTNTHCWIQSTRNLEINSQYSATLLPVSCLSICQTEEGSVTSSSLEEFQPDQQKYPVQEDAHHARNVSRVR